MHIWGKGRAAGRVGSDFLSTIAGWVGSGRVNVSPGRVQEKWPVDNSETERWKFFKCSVLKLI